MKENHADFGRSCFNALANYEEDASGSEERTNIVGLASGAANHNLNKNIQ